MASINIRMVLRGGITTKIRLKIIDKQINARMVWIEK